MGGEKNKQIKNIINIFLTRYFKVIVLILTIMILIVGYSFLIKPKYKQIIQEVKSVSEEKSPKYLNRKKYLNQLKELKAEYQKISLSDINKIKAILPSEKGHEELLAQLEDIILKNGLLLTSLQIEEVAEAKDKEVSRREGEKAEDSSSEDKLLKEINKLKIRMEIIGTDYVGFKNLLNVIENNLRLMDIVSLSFSPDNNTTSLELYVYYIK
jgi:hypothetical protein